MRWYALISVVALLSCSEGVFGGGPAPRGAEQSVETWLSPLSADSKSLSSVRPLNASALGRDGVDPARSRPQHEVQTVAGGIESVATDRRNGVPTGRSATGAEPERLVVVARRRRVPVYEHPDVGSAELGALSAGATVRRTSADEVAGPGCPGGFWGVEPTGFVCGRQVSTDPEHILARALSRRPDRRSPMPYFYGKSRQLPPPFYNRVPTIEQQRRTEPELNLSRAGQAQWASWVGDDVPEFLRDGQATLKFNGERRSLLAVSAGRPIADSAFAFLYLFQEQGRAYGLSTDLSVLPLDHLSPVRPSEFAGVPLGRGLELPLVFVRRRNVQLFGGHPLRGIRVERTVHHREAFSLTGDVHHVGGQTFVGVKSGQWLLDGSHLVRVPALAEQPRWATSGRTWVDISLRQQTLVAYEGTRPVYATLISSGRGSGSETETDFATVEGQFLIHTKHVTATMDSDEPGDEFDLRDVPYVQYFDGNYALHAAFWHDAFGAPRSHGCVNLSPLDARWLFEWTEPKVPERWHSAKSLLRGTLVSIHQ